MKRYSGTVGRTKQWTRDDTITVSKKGFIIVGLPIILAFQHMIQHYSIHRRTLHSFHRCVHTAYVVHIKDTLDLVVKSNLHLVVHLVPFLLSWAFYSILNYLFFSSLFCRFSEIYDWCNMEHPPQYTPTEQELTQILVTELLA